MRQVADGAGISLSLVQYHFETKEALFSAVMERRLGAINSERLMRLDRVEQEARKVGNWDLEALLRAFLEPTVLASRDRDSGGHHYAKLISQISNDPQPHALGVSQKFGDPIARQTMRLLQLALPDLDSAALAWCYVFAVGTMNGAISSTGRVKRLSNGECDPDDVKQIMSFLLPFLSAAFENIAGLCRRGILRSSHDLAKILPLPPLAAA